MKLARGPLLIGVVAAPVGGRLLRMLLRDGDAVTAGEAVATLAPVPLSAREHDEAIARVDAAEATEKSEPAQLQHSRENRRKPNAT